jgi:hypothetical protein
VEKILVFEDGVFKKENMKKALVCHEDLMQGVRKLAPSKDMGKIEKYIWSAMEKLARSKKN